MSFITRNRKSIRLKGYDYSKQGLYFITICCHNRECILGDIIAGTFVANEMGTAAQQCWQQISVVNPRVILHEFVIMPNHLHGILELTVGAQETEPSKPSGPEKSHQFQKIIPRSVGSVIRGFKATVTKWARNNMGIETVWQRNYYEHIIRNDQSYVMISEYIINNPANWDKDRFCGK